MKAFFASLVAALAVLAAACGSNVCTPGVSVACVGTGGCSGGQVCTADGKGYGACMCGTMPDAGTTDLGTPDTGAPDTGAPDTGAPDTGTPDLGPPDLGPDMGMVDVCGSGIRSDTPGCNDCFAMHCCTEATNCAMDPACGACFSTPSDPACTDPSSTFALFNACTMSGSCPGC